MVLAGLFAQFRKKSGGDEEGGAGLDLHVLGLEDLTSNRILKRGLDLFGDQVEANKRTAAAMERVAQTLVDRETRSKQDEIVDRRVEDEVRRRMETERLRDTKGGNRNRSTAAE